MAPFYVYMVFNCLKAAEPLLGDSLLLTTKSPGVPDTHLIDHMHLTDFSQNSRNKYFYTTVTILVQGFIPSIFMSSRWHKNSIF